jgi:hypothetical protein
VEEIEHSKSGTNSRQGRQNVLRLYIVAIGANARRGRTLLSEKWIVEIKISEPADGGGCV